MKSDLKDATFIIPIRIESSDRLRNVITTTAFLLENFDTNIIIKEVDKESIFKREALPILEDILEVDVNIDYIFEKSNDVSFYRQRILNEMILESKTKIVINYDCDVLLPIESYKTAYNMILSNEYDVVYPYGNGEYQKNVIPSDKVVSHFLQTLDYDYLDKHSNSYICNYGFVQFFNRKVYLDGGMENENFIAYAPEDKERFYRFSTLGYNIGRIDKFVYHLEHWRSHNSWFNNPHMQSNNNLWNQLQNMNKQQLIEYYSNQEYLKKYNGQK